MKSNLKLYLEYYKPHKKLFFLDTLFAVLGAAIAVIIPLLIRYISNEVVLWEKASALHSILIIVLCLAAMMLFEMYCNYFIAYYGHIMGEKIEYTMRNQLFAHYQKLSFSFYDKQRVGQLMSRVTNDLFDISELLHHGPEELIVSMIKLFGTLGVLIAINWRLAVIAFAPVPFMVWFAVKYNKKMKRAFVHNRARIAAINSTMEDSLSGIRVVKSFANESVEIHKFEEENAGFVASKKNSYHYMAVYNSVLGLLSTLITIAIAGSGSALLVCGYVEMTDLLVFLIYIGNFVDPIRKLVALTEQFQNGSSGFERFREMMEIEPDIKEAPDAREMGAVKGSISFSGVSFHYDTGAEIFSELNLEVPEGQFVALVGSSGVGKTTLCGLIPRFYDVSAGSISIDGTDVRELKLKSLRNKIGIVQQEVYLFADTIMENIRYGRLDATDEEVIAAAKLANADFFITHLPQGYNTLLTSDGANLSQGQRQLLAIARAAVADPPVLILDEATSSIDTRTEALIEKGMDGLMAGRTVFVIAHRLSTVRNANAIMVLENGEIIERGDHDELLRHRGKYYQLYMGMFELS